MTNSFSQHPEFLTKDFRSSRPPECGVPMNPSITIKKHEWLLPPERVANKRILDIGSFIGQTADWCLSNGAASFTGVEISTEFCTTATELLTKYHSEKDWEIINQSLTDFFAENNEQYDIVFCWGVLFGHHDHVWLLNNLAQRGDHVIVESRHPKWMWRGNQDVMPHDFWYDLEYTVPYSEWQTGDMTMLAAVNGSIKCTAANTSIAGLKLLMELNGFTANLDVYERLKTEFPNNFGMFKDPKKIGRFVVEFFKDSGARHHSLCEDVFADPQEWKANYVDWMAKK
jgi:SAM-dependent methyltransferase